MRTVIRPNVYVSNHQLGSSMSRRLESLTRNTSLAHSLRSLASSEEKKPCRFSPSGVSREERTCRTEGEWSSSFIPWFRRPGIQEATSERMAGCATEANARGSVSLSTRMSVAVDYYLVQLGDHHDYAPCLGKIGSNSRNLPDLGEKICPMIKQPIFPDVSLEKPFISESERK